ncbi:MAG: sigma-70 family RNA polymerase sigma factor [Oligoflexia bacterium]|nr:sigma-70 family RNA polymerase sigma factor [Oligoflexia bacterium]
MQKNGTKELEVFFTEQRKSLVTFSAMMTSNWQDAQEVVQEVFLECLEKNLSSTFNISKAYLFQSVRNRSLNRLRAKGRLQNFLISFKDYLNKYLPLTFGEAQNEANIIELLASLPWKQKEVLILRIKNELSIADIAKILNIPEGTVKSRINEALKILKKQKTN